MKTADRALLLTHPQDNCLIACAAIAAGTRLRTVDGELLVPQTVALGHKVARHALRAGDKVLRYGAVIGSVTRDVAPGEHLHTHNLRSDYLPTHVPQGMLSERT
ncbi:MAG: UxaA family hydrolase [Burkholderiaceae bacterium]